MRTTWMGFLILVFAVVAIGCGPKAETVTPPELTSRQLVRRALEGIIESGRGGSEIGSVITELGQLAKEEPELAADLRADADAMMSGSDAGKIKAKAQAMLDKLDAAPAPGG